MTRAHYLRMAAVVGLTARDALFMCPGVVYDMRELYVKENKKPEKDRR